MFPILLYAITLLVGVLISDLAQRSVLSTAVLFLAAGIGAGAMGWMVPDPANGVVAAVAQLALLSTLFSDGLRLGYKQLADAWYLPMRALVIGLPLTLLAIAFLAWWLAGVTWWAALLIGAVLCPTDPVFASAIVGSRHVPQRVRQLLNVESGFNDGLALPIVLIILAHFGQAEAGPVTMAKDLLLGLLIGVMVPIIAVWLYRRRFLGSAHSYKPLFGFSILLLLWSLAAVLHANIFLAAFAGAITLASISDQARRHFAPMGERMSELLKLAALFIFGAVISLNVVRDVGVGGYLLAAASILIARPVALLLALLGSNLTWQERITAAWFGPKGFASVVFGLLILGSQISDRQHLFNLVAFTVAGSILAHSSTDVLVARWFGKGEPQHKQLKIPFAEA